MIVLLGATGYIGQAFALELQRRGLPFAALSRKEIDYTRFEVVLEYLRRTDPELVINAAGYTGKPNVDACETARAVTLQGNTLFPAMLAHACAVTSMPWGHVSSGCIYSGGKVVSNAEYGLRNTECERVEPDLTKPGLRALFDTHPERFRGFTETDPPNFSFRSPPCSFYSGTKALAEEAIQDVGPWYIWRLRIPFDEIDGPRNYLSKVQRYPKVYDNINSVSHRGDFVRACLDLWERRAPFGIYNVTNPGAVSTRQVVQTIQRILKPTRRFEFWESDEEFYRVAAKTPRSNCILDVSKLLATGVKLRPVHEALENALQNWRKET
ncbi:MAG: sugar nucleotide-binding protein [Pedosphaera parvula]|nr:sugar nucleotide-binding protein [Verrucomicrobiota bacterium]MBI3192186.1 sugar nucleotide-binding protein [Pedosphaera parvula]